MHLQESKVNEETIKEENKRHEMSISVLRTDEDDSLNVDDSLKEDNSLIEKRDQQNIGKPEDIPEKNIEETPSDIEDISVVENTSIVEETLNTEGNITKHEKFEGSMADLQKDTEYKIEETLSPRIIFLDPEEIDCMSIIIVKNDVW